MGKFNGLIHSMLLVASPSFFVCPQYGHSSPQQINFQEIPFANFNLTYDEVLRLLRDIEEGRIDNLSEEELEKISRFLAYLAQIGLLPGESAAIANLESDIAALFEDEEDSYNFSPYRDSSYAYTILPALLNNEDDAMVLLCKHKHKKDKHKHKHKKNVVTHIKDFVKKHKKAIIIGAAILIAAAAVVVAVTAVSSAAAVGATAASAAAAASAPALVQPDKNENTSPPADPNNIPPEMADAIQSQVSSFKEKIAQNQFFQSADPAYGQQGLSWEEDGRVVGSLLAHDGFTALQDQMLYYSGQTQGPYVGHPEIDNKFSTDYTHLFTNPTEEVNFNTLSPQVRGETALTFGYYDQAVHDFGRAIETNPMNPVPYLERGIAHFGLGQYEHSLKDYQQFTTQAQKTNPLPVSEFSLGLAKGVPKGIYESGEGLLLFFADFVTHPIQTSAQMIDAATALVHLVRNDQWGMIAESLSPEMHQLITQWENLSWEQKGELAGYALGKHGTDIFAPGAFVALASKSLKCAQEFAAIAKNIKIAQETLLLETAAEIGSSAKIAEVVEAGQKITFLAEELGFTAREMGQLKQAGKLETSIANSYEHLSLSMQESIALHKKARDALEPYIKKPMPEERIRMYIHETGFRTFPRPIGIPENYVVRITEKGAGMEYVHPTNTHLSVRVMPGKLHSPHPHQQKPYVVQMKDGEALDKFGNKVDRKAAEAHIPYDEFVYRN